MPVNRRCLCHLGTVELRGKGVPGAWADVDFLEVDFLQFPEIQHVHITRNSSPRAKETTVFTDRVRLGCDLSHGHRCYSVINISRRKHRMSNVTIA
jgi:hypothetical protein